MTDQFRQFADLLPDLEQLRTLSGRLADGATGDPDQARVVSWSSWRLATAVDAAMRRVLAAADNEADAGELVRSRLMVEVAGEAHLLALNAQVEELRVAAGVAAAGTEPGPCPRLFAQFYEVQRRIRGVVCRIEMVPGGRLAPAPAGREPDLAMAS